MLYVGTCWNNNPEIQPQSHIYEDHNAPNSTEYVFFLQIFIVLKGFK